MNNQYGRSKMSAIILVEKGTNKKNTIEELEILERKEIYGLRWESVIFKLINSTVVTEKIGDTYHVKFEIYHDYDKWWFVKHSHNKGTVYIFFVSKGYENKTTILKLSDFGLQSVYNAVTGNFITLERNEYYLFLEGDDVTLLQMSTGFKHRLDRAITYAKHIGNGFFLMQYNMVKGKAIGLTKLERNPISVWQYSPLFERLVFSIMNEQEVIVLIKKPYESHGLLIVLSPLEGNVLKTVPNVLNIDETTDGWVLTMSDSNRKFMNHKYELINL